MTRRKIRQRQQLDDRVVRQSLLKLVSAIQTSSETTSFESGTPLLSSKSNGNHPQPSRSVFR